MDASHRLPADQPILPYDLMSLTTPRISIVTPVLNGASHIVQCMNNVQAQKCDDIEHVIVDGGSTDGTQALVRQRMLDDTRVRLIEGPDSGQAHAMNKGVIAALGTVIGLLNVDDAYKPGALPLVLAMFADVPAPAFLWGSCEVIIYHPEKQDVWIQHPGNFKSWRMALGKDFEFHPVNPVSYFYHRSLHFSAGLYDETEQIAMDLEFLLRVPPHLARTLVTDTVLGTFHLTPDTKTWKDAERGTSESRAQVLYQRTRKQLSIADRARYEATRLRLAMRGPRKRS